MSDIGSNVPMTVDVLPIQPGADGIRLLARKLMGYSSPDKPGHTLSTKHYAYCAAASRPQPQLSHRPALSLDTSKAARPPRSPRLLHWPATTATAWSS